MAFSKPVSAATIQSVHKKNHPLQANGGTDIKNNLPQSPSFRPEPSESKSVDPQSWEDWKNKDEQFVTDQFSQDLEVALRLSASDAHNTQEKPLEQKKKRNHKSATMSLEEFTQMATERIPTEQAFASNQPKLSGYAPEELDPNYFEVPDEPVLSAAPSNTDNNNQKKKNKKKNKKKTNEPKASLSDMLSTEQTNGTDHTTTQPGLDATSLAIYQNNLEEKVKEITDLKDENERLVGELTQVKKRNKQLCFILAQGEMKEKADILLQVDELNNIKTELSAELESAYSELEQERSKVSHFKQELVKYQGLRSHNKSISEEKSA